MTVPPPPRYRRAHCRVFGASARHDARGGAPPLPVHGQQGAGVRVALRPAAAQEALCARRAALQHPDAGGAPGGPTAAGACCSRRPQERSGGSHAIIVQAPLARHLHPHPAPQVRPTVLIGVSTVAGAFSREVLQVGSVPAVQAPAPASQTRSMPAPYAVSTPNPQRTLVARPRPPPRPFTHPHRPWVS
jgi:hypothetical protein